MVRRRACPTSTSTTSTTTSSPPTTRSNAWEDLPDAIKNTYERAGHPRSRAQVLGRRHRPVRVRSGLSPQPRGPRAPRCPVLRHGHRRARVPRPRAQVLRHHHPAERQQVRRPQLRGVERWIVHLRAARGQGRPASAGLLPHQHREHGSVRAHTDHRRRGIPGPLRRGLLGAGVLDRLAALSGRGARRPARARASPTRRSRTGRTTSTTS